MSILSDFEDSVSRAVEGVFAGVFRSRVQPAEIAKALGKEMDKKRVVGIGKVYAPNLLTVVISPADEERLGSFTETLAAELATYLVGYAREKGYSLDSRPLVRFRVHDSLKLGRFEVIAELVSASELADAAEEAGFYIPPPAGGRESQPAPGSENARDSAQAPEPRLAQEVASREDWSKRSYADEAPPASRPGPGVTMPPSAIPAGLAAAGGAGGPAEGVGSAAGVGVGAADAAAAGASTEAGDARPTTMRALSTVTVSGIDHDVVLRGDRVVVGRHSSADIRLSDQNVSREHAAFVAQEGGWQLTDLNSTNGTFVNGKPVQRVRLLDGDVITMGISELVFHEPRG